MGQGYNHYDGCSCGWCVGNNGGGGGFVDSDLITYYRHAVESYLNPNANCPVCGEKVYFYRSPYDGRVFFDDLAPLWTKHPCTDTSQNPFLIPESSRTEESKTSKEWMKHSWERFQFLEGDTFLDADRVLITGYLESVKNSKIRRLGTERFNNYGPTQQINFCKQIGFRLFVEGKNWFTHKMWIFSIFPVYIKPKVELGHYTLSTYVIKDEVLTKLEAFAWIPAADLKFN